MVMICGTPQDRANAWQAATQFCAGTGWAPESLVHVAEVGLAYILNGPEAALKKATEGISTPQEQEARAARPSGIDTGSKGPDSAAQALADAAYLATDRPQIKTLMDRAAHLVIADEPIEIEGITGTLRGYLNSRWNALRNSDLGL